MWREYDPEMAKQLIQEAIDAGEWDPGRTIVFIDDAERPIWNLWIEMMREVGLNVEMQIVGLALADKLLAGEYDVSEGGGAGVRGYTLRACYYFGQPNGRNYENTAWHDEEFGRLCMGARGTPMRKYAGKPRPNHQDLLRLWSLDHLLQQCPRLGYAIQYLRCRSRHLDSAGAPRRCRVWPLRLVHLR